MLNQKKLIIIIFVISVGVSFSTHNSFGHGLGYEVLPPVMLGDREVALEVTSAQYLDPQSTNRQVTFSLFETATTVTVRDVTYHITASKGNDFLFEDTFKSDNGIFTMNFIPIESGPIELQEETQGSFFDSILGMQKDIISIKGQPFNSGGLYNFEVEILTADSYSNELDEPILYNVGLSIEDRTFYDIEDANFGNQKVSLITYYDQVENFQYDQKSSSISFSMPLEWTVDNINQTSVVHEEVVISKTFGDLMVDSLSVFLNGIELPQHVITLDGFSEYTRIIHVVINQVDLFNLYNELEAPTNMEFLIKPSSEDLPLETITGNGQFKIKLDWEPREVKSGSNLKLYFDTKDVFFKDKPISVSYDLLVLYDGNEIFTTSGISTDSRDEHNVVEFSIPENVNGPITIQFDNLNDNSLARVGLPIVVNRIYDFSNGVQDEISIPDWVRNNAGWWAAGTITDDDFVSGIQYLIEKKIMIVPSTEVTGEPALPFLPNWIKDTAMWWADGKVTDNDFVNGIQYLISHGIIRV